MTSSPVQTSVKSAVAVTTGNGLTVTSMVAVFSQPVAASVPVTVYDVVPSGGVKATPSVAPPSQV